MDFVLAGVTEVEARAAAIITGFAGIVASVGGVIMTLRRVKSREQRAAQDQLKTVEGYLSEERAHRIEAEQGMYMSDVMLVQHGLTPPVHHKFVPADTEEATQEHEPDLDSD